MFFECDQLMLEWVGVLVYYYVVMMCMIVIGDLELCQVEFFEVCCEVIEVIELVLCLGNIFGMVFDVYVCIMDECGLVCYCFNVCGYLFGVCFLFLWMEQQMFYVGNLQEIELGMMFFVYMIIMDFELGFVMIFGQIYLIMEDVLKGLL